MNILNSKGNQNPAACKGKGVISALKSLGYDPKPDDLTQGKVKR